MGHDFAASQLQHHGQAFFPQDTWRNYDDGVNPRAQRYSDAEEERAAAEQPAEPEVDERLWTKRVIQVGVALAGVAVAGVALDAIVRAARKGRDQRGD